MVSLVDNGLKDLNLLFCDDGAVQSTDELFCFAGEHAAANHFNPAGLFTCGSAAEVWFNKHDAKYPARDEVCKSGLKIGRLSVAGVLYVRQVIFFRSQNGNITADL